jgi:hypothetical protein
MSGDFANGASLHQQLGVGKKAQDSRERHLLRLEGHLLWLEIKRAGQQSFRVVSVIGDFGP